MMRSSLEPVFPAMLCILLALLGFTIHSCQAIDCYVCKSDSDSACTATKPSGDAIQAMNCSDPNKLFNDWIMKHDFMKSGFGDVNLANAVNSAEKKTEEDNHLKNITACAYFLVSSENKATEAIDKGVSQARSFFGDKNADESVTIKKYVMRDCVTLSIKEDAEKDVNKCVPIGDSSVAKLRFCTCTTDKCNKPDSDMEGFIKDAETQSSGDHFFASEMLLAFAVGVGAVIITILQKML